MIVVFSWNGYTPGSIKGTATWSIGGYTQAAEFPSFTHAHAINQLVEAAYRAGKRDGAAAMHAVVTRALESTP